MMTTTAYLVRRRRLLNGLHRDARTTSRQLWRNPLSEWKKEMTRDGTVVDDEDRLPLLDAYLTASAALDAAHNAVRDFEDQVLERRRYLATAEARRHADQVLERRRAEMRADNADPHPHLTLVDTSRVHLAREEDVLVAGATDRDLPCPNVGVEQ
jgi:hypothetical protein